jgi:hypothetical protein
VACRFITASRIPTSAARCRRGIGRSRNCALGRTASELEVGRARRRRPVLEAPFQASRPLYACDLCRYCSRLSHYRPTTERVNESRCEYNVQPCLGCVTPSPRPGHQSAIISADGGPVPSRLRMLSPGFGRATRSRHPFHCLGRSPFGRTTPRRCRLSGLSLGLACCS